nr:hypothetical protein [Tanacetum cinerariifolium]
DLHPDRLGSPPAQPGQDPAGNHRSPVGQLPGRRRHRALRRRLRSLYTGH